MISKKLSDLEQFGSILNCSESDDFKWGLLHGIVLAVHKGWMELTGSKNKKQGMQGSAVSILVTFLFTMFCWIFLRVESIGKAFLIIRRMFSFESGLELPYMWLFIAVIVLSTGNMIAFVRTKKKDIVENKGHR